MKIRKSWLVISLFIIACMLLSACGTKASSKGEGIYLTLNYEQVSTWVRNFNPFSANALGSTFTAIYEPMMIYNKATGELVPWLATNYQWSEDNLTLTFTIRQNVKWSDGEPFPAKDVVYTYTLLQNNEALTGTATSVLNE
jgi:peptide/nickel transport system substrate-binding protein